MAWFPCKSGTGMPSGLQTQMDAVLNKKFGTSTTYPATDWPDTVNLMGVLPIRTATKGAICTFSDGADGVPCPSVLCEINPLQASGTPSPSNPLAISGFTGLTLTNKDDISNPTHTDTLSVTWQSTAGTVYGGTLDVVSGVLTVTTFKYSPSSSTGFSIDSQTSSYIVCYFSYYSNRIPAGIGGGFCISNRFSKNIPTGTPGRMVITNNQIYVVIPKADSSTWTVSNIQQWFEDNPTDFVYELATPTTYQLTPQEVNSLLATNNFYHDANGDTQVQYRADIDLLINELGG